MFKKKENEYNKYAKLYSEEVANHEQTRHELEMKIIELQGQIGLLENEIEHLKEMNRLWQIKCDLNMNEEKCKALFDPDKRL